MPLLDLPRIAMTSDDASVFGGVLDQALPVKVTTWDPLDARQPFFNKAAALQLGDLSLLSTFGSGFDGSLERQRHAHVVLPYAPQLAINDYRLAGRTYRFQDEGLFLSQEQAKLRIHASFCAAVVFTFPPREPATGGHRHGRIGAGLPGHPGNSAKHQGA